MSGSREIATFGFQAVYEDQDSGELFCSCPDAKSKFCEHIERVYRQNLDGAARLRVGEVEVVLFKTPLVVATVETSGPDRAMDYSVLLRDPHDIATHIGFVRERDGRLVLRRLIVDFLIDQFTWGTNIDTCPSPHHYVPKIMSGQHSQARMVPTSPWALREVLSVFTTGFCTECATGGLVPEEERPPSPFRR